MNLSGWSVAPCEKCGDPKAPHYRGRCALCPSDRVLEEKGQVSLLDVPEGRAA